MKLLHLCHDEKVIPFVQRLYEIALPESNRFRIWGPRPGSPTRHARLGPESVLVPKSYWFSRQMRREVQESDILLIHYLTPTFARAIRAATERQMVVWCGWGGDYFDLLDGYSSQLRLPSSRRLDELASASRSAPGTSTWLKSLLKYPIDAMEFVDNKDWVVRTLPRIDWFVESPQSHRLLAASRAEFRAGHHWIPYYCTEDMPSPPPGGPTGTNILLGNSATAPNNHVEALQGLSALNLNGRKVIVPLSYGCKEYARRICSVGRRLLGAAFVPLTEFIPLQEYLALLQTCSVVIMNHVRAQGVGNIAAALRNGSHVYVRPENIWVDFFRERDITLSTWRDRPSQEMLDGLDPAAQTHNRLAVQRMFGMAKAVESVRQLVELRLPEAYSWGQCKPPRRSMRESCLWIYNAAVEKRHGLNRNSR